MNDVRPHPTWLEQQLKLVPARRRFSVSIREAPDAGEKAIQRLEGAIRTGAPHPVAQQAFRRLRPLLDLPQTCELHGDLGSRPHARSRYLTDRQMSMWQERYLRHRKRTVWDINLDAEGIRDDQAFWWWVIRGPVEALLWLPLSRFDVSTHLRDTMNPGERYNARMSSRAAKVARDRTKKGDIICIAPGTFMSSIELAIVAGEKQLPRLYQEALGCLRFEQPFLAGTGGAIRPADDFNVIGSIVDLQFKKDWDYWFAARFRLAAKRVADSDAVNKAMIAGEVLATIEGRGDGPGLALDEDNLNKLVSEAAKHAPLALETLSLARETVERLSNDTSFGDRKIITEEVMAPWREMAQGLAKRLRAVEATRKARLTSPNAAPLVVPEDVDVAPVPEDYRESRFFVAEDDLEALFAAIENAGVKVLEGPADGEDFREISNAWDFRQHVEAAREFTPFGVPESHVVLWWPSASTAPSRMRRVYERDEWDDAVGDYRIVRDETWVAGWGMGWLLVRGTVRKENRVAESLFRYQTSRRFSHARLGRPGPWNGVEWKQLQAGVKALRVALVAAAGGRRTKDTLKLPVLPGAAARLDDGWTLGDRFGDARKTRN